MRRFSSVILILLFWLGPLAASFQAQDESRLPACCRRHGAHHCAMDEQTAAGQAQAASGSGTAFKAPERCPYFPGSNAQIPTPVLGMSAAKASFPVRSIQHDKLSELLSAIRSLPIRPGAVRGPPVSI